MVVLYINHRKLKATAQPAFEREEDRKRRETSGHKNNEFYSVRLNNEVFRFSDIIKLDGGWIYLE